MSDHFYETLLVVRGPDLVSYAMQNFKANPMIPFQGQTDVY